MIDGRPDHSCVMVLFSLLFVCSLHYIPHLINMFYAVVNRKTCHRIRERYETIFPPGKISAADNLNDIFITYRGADQVGVSRELCMVP